MKPMNAHSAGHGGGALRRAGLLAFVAGAMSLAGSSALAGQTAPRLWAAQTGPNEVTLTWDSIPGSSDYLIYAAPLDSVVGNLRMKPPLRRLSRSSRSTVVYGIRQLVGGVTLVAMAENGHVIQKLAFNAITPAASLSPIQPPEEVTAAITGPTQITLAWTPVPGATAYYIGRAVTPAGLMTLCRICSAEPRYVDNDVTPGPTYLYTVAAIFPHGRSRPAPSNRLTPGVTQVATASSAGQPTTGTPQGTTSSATTTNQTPPGTSAGSTTTGTAGTPAGSGTGTSAGSTTATTGTPAGTGTGAPQPADTAPPLVNPQMPAFVPPMSPPPIGPAPSGATSLVTPSADTGSCVVSGTPNTSTTVNSPTRLDQLATRIDARTSPNPDAPTATSTTITLTTTNYGSADYQRGKCLNPGAIGYPALWDRSPRPRG